MKRHSAVIDAAAVNTSKILLRCSGNQQRAKIRTRQNTALATSLLCREKQQVIMSKPIASGTARKNDRNQIDKISMTVSRGMPTPCTLLQEATALYL
ncbi:hypothetical protein EYF80_000147 [Liparis tanakae]|uniref:Uncharacterized protein n=1 Tax=Liparis tanakae TaxID=230148 RepID=A0A4Z2JIF9_9TELE|nr:hypothetical protein EYF80_000147 [Liparis tanakae]